MSRTTIYLVRHADVHNPQNICYGRLPRFRLSELGRRQAEYTAQYLAGRPLAAIYTSPQLRARQTAAILARAHADAPLRVSHLIAEVKTGWQGQPNDVLGRGFDFYGPLRYPDDETIEDVFRRVDRMVGRLRRRHAGEEVVCVTHGDPIMIARAGYNGWELSFANIRRGPYAEKGSVTALEFTPGGGLPRLSYVSPATAAV